MLPTGRNLSLAAPSPPQRIYACIFIRTARLIHHKQQRARRLIATYSQRLTMDGNNVKPLPAAVNEPDAAAAVIVAQPENVEVQLQALNLNLRDGEMADEDRVVTGMLAVYSEEKDYFRVLLLLANPNHKWPTSRPFCRKNLIRAVFHRDANALEKCYKMRVYPFHVMAGKVRGLHSAAESVQGYMEAVPEALQKQDEVGSTPLHYAVKSGRPLKNAVWNMAGNRVPVGIVAQACNLLDKKSKLPLHYACMNHYVKSADMDLIMQRTNLDIEMEAGLLKALEESKKKVEAMKDANAQRRAQVEWEAKKTACEAAFAKLRGETA